MTSLQLGGYDPLDVQLDDVAMAPARGVRRSSLRRRLAGWSASSVPVASLLLVGMAIGPRGLSLLSPRVLSFLDPALPVALAVLGALVGLSVDVRTMGGRRAVTGALVESALTTGLVAAGIVLLAPIVWPATTAPLWVLAGGLGLCAATSLSVPSGNPAEPRARDRRVVEIDVLDVLAPIVMGGLLLGAIPHGATLAAITFVGQAAVIVVILAASAWLLLARTASDTEQRVFVFAAMLLVGGAADYLLLSALMSGLVAGAFWRLAGGTAEAAVRRDARYVQHSLLVLVLVVAGARTEFTAAAFAIAAIYVFLRTAGKLLGGWAGRMAGTDGDRALAGHLLSPGVFGIAFALNLFRSGLPDANTLLSIVVLGTVGAELVAEIGRPLEAKSAEIVEAAD
jgi:hypothetical protein